LFIRQPGFDEQGEYSVDDNDGGVLGAVSGEKGLVFSGEV